MAYHSATCGTFLWTSTESRPVLSLRIFLVKSFVLSITEGRMATKSVDNPTARRQRAPSFKMEVPGNAEVKARLMLKMSEVRKKMEALTTRYVNNAEILESLMDYWLKARMDAPATTHHVQQPTVKAMVSSKLYVTTKTSLQKFSSLVENHSRGCKSRLTISQITRRGHAGLLKLKCGRRGGKRTHTYWCATSERFPGGKYLANERILHGLMFSGMRPSHYRRFVAGANLGLIDEKARNLFYKKHSPHVEAEYYDSIDTALLQEVAMYDMGSDDQGEEWHGIDVTSDARHGHRRNAKDTSVVVLGEKTKKVLGHFHITKSEDPCTQRHEKLGVINFYDYMEGKDIPVRVHTHDRNMSINAYIRSLNGPVNQNDRWHGIKNLKKSLETISRGRKRDHGRTWHQQLEDKVEPVATHAHWAIEHCGGDPNWLQEKLLSVVDHYTDDHSKCSQAARCRTDPKYEPSRILLTNPKAQDLLCAAIRKSTLFSSANDFVHGKYTSHVESFNNVMNMFHDKRIYYSDKEYLTRSQITVLYWNENSGRKVNSVWQARGSRGSTRSARQRKNYSDATFQYRQNIWESYCRELLQ